MKERDLNALRMKSNEAKNAATIALTLIFCLGFSCAVRADDSYQAERERVEKMNDAEKAELLRKFKQFNGLDAAEQAKLRKLNEEIEKDPEAKDLTSVMDGYSKWLETLPAYERAELQSMPPKERVEWIKKRLQEENERWQPHGLAAKDVESLRVWLRGYAEKKKEAFAEKLTKEQRDRIESGIKAEFRSTVIASLALWSKGGNPFGDLSEAEIAEVECKLSAEAREQLKGKNAGEKKKIVREWLGPIFFQQFVARRDFHSAFDEDQLAKFFEKLPEDQRNRLLNLPVDQMQRQLFQMYVRQEGFMGPGFPGMPGRGRDQRRGEGMRPRGPGGEGQEFNGPPMDRGQPPADGEGPSRDGDKKKEESRPSGSVKSTEEKAPAEKTAAEKSTSEKPAAKPTSAGTAK